MGYRIYAIGYARNMLKRGQTASEIDKPFTAL